MCTLIEARTAKFNPVNVATTFRTLLQSLRDGGPRRVVERALQSMEAAALRTIDTFGAQEVSNNLHIIVKTRYSPWDRTLIPELEGRTEAVAGTFNTQDVANALWAYVTMGRESGAGMMWELEGRSEALAGTFKVQEVANTLRANTTMGGTGMTVFACLT